VYLKVPVQRHQRRGRQTKRNVFRSFLGSWIHTVDAGHNRDDLGHFPLARRVPIYCGAKKTALLYFCNNFAKTFHSEIIIGIRVKCSFLCK